MFKETKKVIVNFFKKIGIDDKLVEVPKSIKKMGTKIELYSLVMTITSLVFAFLLKITNALIEIRLILLAMIIFMLYRGEQIIREAIHIFDSSERNKYDLIYNDEIVYRGSKIIGKVRDKVLKYDDENKIYKIMSNENALNTIKNYLNRLWDEKITHKFEYLDMFSILIMLIIAVLTNTSIPNKIFIPLVIIFCIISLISTAILNMSRSSFYKKHRTYDNEQAVITNDLLRVPSIIPKDLDMRINKYKKTVVESNKNIKKFYKKTNISNLIVTIMETFAQYGIIIFYLLNLKLENVTLSTIADLTATLVIFESALNRIQKMGNTLNNHNNRITILEREEEDMKLILDTYNLLENEQQNIKPIDNIVLKPFTIKYQEYSDNDIPFTLISNKEINIEKGEVGILYGPSGSGKTTFMNMVTGRIKLEKDTDIPTASRFIFYDEKLKFGSLNMYEELFCGEVNPNLNKMQNILENLNLWDEIKAVSCDIWAYMKEKQFDHSLSNGQKQRLILAKILYFLDDNIDALILDECTSGLDDESKNESIDANKILDYIVRYANKDRKRIVLISTHQNIDSFKESIKKDFKVRNFNFEKEDNYYVIKEIV